MILWDEDKNSRLRAERGICFEDIADIILAGYVLDVIDHPNRHGQKLFVIDINDYIYAVPFIVDEKENIILKTAFPTRKLKKKYRGEK